MIDYTLYYCYDGFRYKFTQLHRGEESCSLSSGLNFLRGSPPIQKTPCSMFCPCPPCGLRSDPYSNLLQLYLPFG